MVAKDAEILLLSRAQIEAIENGDIASLETDDRTWFVGLEEDEDAVMEAIDEADVDVDVNRLDVDRKVL